MIGERDVLPVISLHRKNEMLGVSAIGEVDCHDIEPTIGKEPRLLPCAGTKFEHFGTFRDESHQTLHFHIAKFIEVGNVEHLECVNGGPVTGNYLCAVESAGGGSE